MKLNEEQELLVNEYSNNILLLASSNDINYKNIINDLYKYHEEKVNQICSEKGKLNVDLKSFLKEKGDVLLQTYNSLLYSNHGLDFDDLVFRTKELFNDKSVLINYISNKFLI